MHSRATERLPASPRIFQTGARALRDQFALQLGNIGKHGNDESIPW